jgi:hypothetical protein
MHGSIRRREETSTGRLKPRGAGASRRPDHTRQRRCATALKFDVVPTRVNVKEPLAPV